MPADWRSYRSEFHIRLTRGAERLPYRPHLEYLYCRLRKDGCSISQAKKATILAFQARIAPGIIKQFATRPNTTPLTNFPWFPPNLFHLPDGPEREDAVREMLRSMRIASDARRRVKSIGYDPRIAIMAAVVSVISVCIGRTFDSWPGAVIFGIVAILISPVHSIFWRGVGGVTSSPIGNAGTAKSASHLASGLTLITIGTVCTIGGFIEIDNGASFTGELMFELLIAISALLGGAIWFAITWPKYRSGFRTKKISSPQAVKEPSSRAEPSAASSARTSPQTARATHISHFPQPITVRSELRGIEFTADRSGIKVRHQAAASRGRGGWRTSVDLGWGEIERLVFDTDHRDPIVSLYAVRFAGGRVHVVDSRSISETSWEKLAARIPALTEGRLIVDLAQRDNPGPDRYF